MRLLHAAQLGSSKSMPLQLQIAGSSSTPAVAMLHLH
jgi:hypothetical protein